MSDEEPPGAPADLTEASPLWRRVLWSYTSPGLAIDGFELAFAAGDPMALATVAICEQPSAGRLAALLDDHPDVVAEHCRLTATTQVSTEHDHAVTELLDAHPSRVPLAADIAREVAEALTEIGETIHAPLAVALLGWLDTHHPDLAADVARHRLQALPEGSELTPVTAFAVQLLGHREPWADRWEVWNRALLESGGGPTPIVNSLLAGLVAHDDDLDQIRPLYERYATSNWPPPEELGRLVIDHEPATAVKAAIGVPSPWAEAHLMPLLVEHHPLALIPTITDNSWPAVRRRWLVEQARWPDHAWGPLLEALAGPSHDELRTQAQATLWARTSEAINAGAVGPDRLSEIGVAVLLNEAIDGRLDPASTYLDLTAKLADQAARLAAYSTTRWPDDPERADRFSAVLAHQRLIDDLAPLASRLKRTKAAVRAIVATRAAPELREEAAATLVERFLGDPKTLAALAGGPAGVGEIAQRWATTGDFAMLRALPEGSDHRVSALNVLGDDLWSDHYDSEQRRELLQAMRAENADTHASALAVLRRQVAGTSVPDHILAVAVDELADHEGDPTPVVDALAPICRGYRGTTTRSAAYRVLGGLHAPYVVDLLLERADHEAELADEVRAALDRLAIEQLEPDVDHAASSERRAALELLGRVQPERAAGAARRRVDDDDPEVRQVAAEILGRHGDPDNDPELLAPLAERDPSPAVKDAAASSIRLLVLGDVAGAHRYLGELLGAEPARWSRLDPSRLYGKQAEALRKALDHVERDLRKRDWTSAITFLGGEASRILLCRAIVATGASTLGVKPEWVARVDDNLVDCGEVLDNIKLQKVWPWMLPLVTLYKLRRAHVSPKGSVHPLPDHNEADWNYAIRLFQDGAGPCLAVIEANA